MPLSSPSFLDLPEHLTDFATSKYAILPFPMELSTSYLKGTAQGPSAIISASAQVETFDSETQTEPSFSGIHTLSPLAQLPGELPKAWLERAANTCHTLLTQGKTPIALGGEHTITVGTFSGLYQYLMERNPELPVGVLQIDAHADLRDTYQDTPYSHACAMRRILFSNVRLAAVGIRSLCAEEWEFILKNPSILCITDREWHTSDRNATTRKILSHLPRDIYITIDVDGLDPAIMPAVGTPEPGGLGWYELLSLLRITFQEKTVHACDVNELMPVPTLKYADFTAAKLVYKLISYHFGS